MSKTGKKTLPIREQTLKFNHLRNLSHLLDNAISIPGTSYRFGIDPLLGLIPAAGDYLGTALSTYIVIQAALMGVSQPTLYRMTFNIILDTLIGTVPLLGDFFDLSWKANTKNIALLEEHLKFPEQRVKTDWLFIFILLVTIFLVLATTTALFLFIINLFLKIIK